MHDIYESFERNDRKINATIHSFFVNVYKTGCKNYSFQDCVKIINFLKEADLKFKGIHGGFRHDFLKELVLRIIY